MGNRREENRCQGRTKSGEPCKAAATAGGLCFFHANPAKASELGRLGGRKNRHVRAEQTDPLPDLSTALAVRETVERLVKEVVAGKMNPRIAAGLAPLLSLQLRAIETSDFERRLAALEQSAKQNASEESRRIGWTTPRQSG